MPVVLIMTHKSISLSLRFSGCLPGGSTILPAIHQVIALLTGGVMPNFSQGHNEESPGPAADRAGRAQADTNRKKPIIFIYGEYSFI
jgi:hypothetical protein